MLRTFLLVSITLALCPAYGTTGASNSTKAAAAKRLKAKVQAYLNAAIANGQNEGTASSVTVQANDSTGIRQAMIPITLGQSRTEMNTMIKGAAKSKQFSASTQLTFGTATPNLSTSTENTNYFLDKTAELQFTTIRPQLAVELKENQSLYGSLPMTWATYEGTPFRTIGRPEIGAFTTLTSSENLNTGAGLSVRLPVYDTSIGVAEAGRAWQIAGGLTADRRLGRSANHVLAAGQLAYDTPSTYKIRNEVGSHDITEEHTLALRTALGISRETPTGSVGVTLHAINGFGSSVQRDANTGGVIHESALSLSSGEVFASYNWNEQTKLNASLARGFNTKTDGLMLLDTYRDIADTTLSVGLTETF